MRGPGHCSRSRIVMSIARFSSNFNKRSYEKDCLPSSCGSFSTTFLHCAIQAQTIPTPTQTDVIILDNNTNGKADPGDQIQYKVTIQSTGNPAATGVPLNLVPDPHHTLMGPFHISRWRSRYHTCGQCSDFRGGFRLKKTSTKAPPVPFPSCRH